MSNPDFDPYHEWLGIPPDEQPANHYRLLGLELFEEDGKILGLVEGYQQWKGCAVLGTANGRKSRRIFMVEAQLVMNGALFGPVCTTTATLTPGSASGELRCSGKWVRQNLFTVTNPAGMLCLSDCKTGLALARGLLK